MLTRAWTGRLGRAIASDYTRAWELPAAPRPAPYPIQRGLASALRESGTKAGDIHRMQAWAGQSAAMAKTIPAGDVVGEMWKLAETLLP
jgi:nitronate monooxygenase